MFNYARRATNDIARWRDAGLIDAPTAEALTRDVESRAGGGFSFGSVLALMAGALVAAAVLIMVAANWEDFPRLARVVAIFAIILAGYVGGAVLVLRGHRAFGEAAWLVAAAAFGGAIALIAQMYHLSGDETQAVLLWFAGTALAAAALKSGPLNAGAVLLACGWLTMQARLFGSGHPVPHLFLVLLAILWAISLWTGSRTSRYLILAAGILYGIVFYWHSELLFVLVGLAIVYGGLVALSSLAPDIVEKVLRLGSGVAVIGLGGFLTAMWALQVIFSDSASLILCALVTFGGIAAVLAGSAGESRGLRWLAYAGFTIEIGFVYIQTIGSMIGTAGLFLASGLALGIAAYVIIRVERRFTARAAAAAGQEAAP